MWAKADGSTYPAANRTSARCRQAHHNRSAAGGGGATIGCAVVQSPADANGRAR